MKKLTGNDFEADPGEEVRIRIEPIRVGHTYTVGEPAVLVDGGNNDDHATYGFRMPGPARKLTIIAILFRFPESPPAGGFTPDTRPRFEVIVSAPKSGQSFKLPSVRQLNPPAPLSQDFTIGFAASAAAAIATPRAAASTRKAASKKAGRKKAARKKSSKKKSAPKKKVARKKKASRKPRRRGKA